MKKILVFGVVLASLSFFLVSCDKETEIPADVNDSIEIEVKEGEKEVKEGPEANEVQVAEEEKVVLPETRLPLLELEKKMIAPSNDYTFSFIRDNYLNDKDILFSPLGFQLTIAMAGNYSNNEVVSKLIGFGEDDYKVINDYFNHLIEALSGEKCNKELKLANALMTDVNADPFPEEFLDVLKSSYHTDYIEIEAKSLIEQPVGSRPEDLWCKEKTDGMIETAPFVIRPEQCSLFNAFCFNGEWQNKFDKERTLPDMFFINPSKTVTVPLMHKQSKISFYKNDDFSAVSLPFGDGTYDLSILLPRVPFNHLALLGKLDSGTWESMRNGLVNKEVIMSIPVFSTTYSIKMMVPELDERFMFVGQNAIFRMDEDGASAAAVTQTMEATAPGPSEEPKIETFLANNPFIYTISESGSGLILFIGIYSGADKIKEIEE